jgi:hypothetical protein
MLQGHMVKERSNRLRLPQTIAVGPKRTGTTWLYENLLGQVGLPYGVKETHFFNRFYDQGIEWYGRHFLHCSDNLPIVEVCPSYFHSQAAQKRIAAHIPGCKIICTLRNPADRAYSLYRLYKIYGETTLTFEEAFEGIAEFKESSLYIQHLRSWQENFGSDNVLIMIFNDLKQNPQGYIKRICDFIGIPEIVFNEDALKAPEKELLSRNRHLAYLGEQMGFLLRYFQMYKVLNALKRLGLRKLLFEGGKDLPPINPETAKRLRAYFLPEVEGLEKIMGRDFSGWK